jgi:hypothetical protein
MERLPFGPPIFSGPSGNWAWFSWGSAFFFGLFLFFDSFSFCCGGYGYLSFRFAKRRQPGLSRRPQAGSRLLPAFNPCIEVQNAIAFFLYIAHHFKKWVLQCEKPRHCLRSVRAFYFYFNFLKWWAMQGLNLRPWPCKDPALPLS